MQFSKCPVCRSTPIEPINLRCDHHPCFACATSIMTVDQDHEGETKYRIVCPICNKKTLTYDIRHLIVNMTEQDEDLYCTTKFIGQKPEVVIKKTNNFTSSQRNSISSKTRPPLHQIHQPASPSRNIVKIQCKRHPTKYLQYFCDTCFKNDFEDAFLCQQCASSHTHNISSIKEAQSSLCSMNQQKLHKVMPMYKNQLGKCIKEISSRRQSLKSEYEKLQKEITQEFKQIYQSLNKQFQSVKKDMKDLYMKQSQNLKNSHSLATRLKESLSGLEKMYKIDNNQLEGQISFHNYFFEVGRAIETNKKSLSKDLEIPKLVRKAAISFNNEPLVELKIQRGHEKKDSKLSSGVVSPRIQDYNSEGEQISKKLATLTRKKQSKENIISGVSPRQKFSFQSLFFAS